MVFVRMLFCKVVSLVGCSVFLIDNKLSLAYAVMNPIKAHVHGFGLLLFHTIVCDVSGRGVVGDHQGCRLWMSKFFEGNSFGDSFFAVMEQTAKFRFGGTG
jgi:hypothetical protein